MTPDTRATALSALLFRLISKSEHIDARRDVASAVRELVSTSYARGAAIRYCKSIVRIHKVNRPCAK